MGESQADTAPLSASGAVEVFATPYTGESKARGVQARTAINRGSLVEVSHAILVPRDQYMQHMRQTVLEHYLFHTKQGDMLLALGFGSLFNHSQQPNLDYRVDAEEQVIRYYAARKIVAGEELTIYYGSNLWFEDTTCNARVESSDTDDEAAVLGRLQLSSSDGDADG